MSSMSVMRLLVSVLVVACVGAYFAGCKKDSSPAGPSGGAGSVINVTGKVIGLNGQPAPGLPVLVAGKPSVNTDPNGAFAIPSVTTPYDVTVIVGSLKQAYIYRRLTRSDPTLMFIGAAAGSPNTATISGKIYPSSAFPHGDSRSTNFSFIAPEVAGVSDSVDGTVSPGVFSQTFAWYGAASVTGTLHALQWDVDASGLPTTYLRYGSRSGIVVTSGGTFPTLTDTMTVTPGTVTLSGSVSAPAGYIIGEKVLYAQFGGRTGFPLVGDLTPGAAFSYKMPDISGFTAELIVGGGKVGSGESLVFKSGISPGATGVTITMPAAPELSLPIDGASNVKTGMPFSWNAFAGGVHVLFFNGPTNQPDIYIMTAAASDSLPDLATAGLPTPASTSYSWYVLGVSPFASVDAATGPNGFLPAGFLYGAIEGNGNIGNSMTRTFTTAP